MHNSSESAVRRDGHRLKYTLIVAVALVAGSYQLYQPQAAHRRTHASALTSLRPATGASAFDIARAIDDVDRDGAPDIISAGRLSTWNGRTRYAVDADLSHGGRQRIVFSSPEPALQLAILDVDGDGDRDVIFTPLLGRQVAAILTNDGTGRFEQRLIHPRARLYVPARFALSAPVNRHMDGGLECGAGWVAAVAIAPLHGPGIRSASQQRDRDRRPYRALLDFPLFTRPPPASAVAA